MSRHTREGRHSHLSNGEITHCREFPAKMQEKFYVFALCFQEAIVTPSRMGSPQLQLDSVLLRPALEAPASCSAVCHLLRR